MHSEELNIEENIFKPRKIVFPKDLELSKLKKVLISFKAKGICWWESLICCVS